MNIVYNKKCSVLYTLILILFFASFQNICKAQSSEGIPPVDSAMSALRLEADILRSQGKSLEAMEIYHPLLEEALEKKQWQIATFCYFGLGTIYADRGQTEWSYQSFVLPGLALLKEKMNDDIRFILAFKMLIAQHYLNTGRLSKAFAEIDSCFSIFPQAKHATRQAGFAAEFQLTEFSLINLAQNSHTKSEQYQRARKYVNEMYNLATNLDFPNPESTAIYQTLLTGMYYSNMGVMFEGMTKLDSALWAHKNAVELLESFPNQFISAAYFNLAAVYFRLGKLEDARNYIWKSIQSMNVSMLKNAPELTKNYLLLSDISLKKGQTDSAFYFIEKVLTLRGLEAKDLDLKNEVPDLSSLDLDEYVFIALNNLGKINLELAQEHVDNAPFYLNVALEYGQAVRNMLDSLRQSGYLGIIQEEFVSMDTVSLLMKSATQIAYELAKDLPRNRDDYIKEALLFSEANKYNQLFYGITRRDIENIDGLPNDSLNKERLIHDEIAYYSSAILAGIQGDAPDSMLTKLKLQLEEERNRLSSLKVYFKQYHPRYYKLRYNHEKLDLDLIQNNLKPNQAILEFFYGEAELFSFLITQDTMVMDAISIEENLWASIENFHKGISHYSRDKAAYLSLAKSSHLLYKKFLFEPISLLKEIDPGSWQLSIIPDGPLQKISWAACITELPEESIINVPASWKYLVKDKLITLNYQHSIQFMLFEPVKAIENYDKRYAGFGAWYAESDLEKGRNSVVEISEMDFWDKQADAFIGSPDKPLSKEIFWDKAGKYQIMHLSMHGLANWDEPMYSKLLFSEEDSLTLGELYQKNVPTELIILDACEMAIGKSEGGEGVISMAVAMTYAGAPSTLTSLWQVSEKSSNFLIKQFLHFLNEGMQKDLAWQKAQLTYLENSSNNMHPFFWASIIPVGDMSPLADQWIHSYLLIFLGAIFILSLGLIIIKIRRRAL